MYTVVSLSLFRGPRIAFNAAVQFVTPEFNQRCDKIRSVIVVGFWRRVQTTSEPQGPVGRHCCIEVFRKYRFRGKIGCCVSHTQCVTRAMVGW
jgi:hypothetical protein